MKASRLIYFKMAAVTFFALISESTYADFASGFNMGSAIGQQAVVNSQNAEALANQRRQQILQYGTPALNRIDALEKTADKWAYEAAQSLKRIRAENVK